MNYSINSRSNESNDLQYDVPIQYFYRTTSTINPTRSTVIISPIFIDRLLSSYNQQNSFNYENENYDNNNNSELFSNTPIINPIILNNLYNIDESNNDISNIFFPTVNLIERIFNDYIENKNKLNDEEYIKNVEKISQTIDECPVCFASSETAIKIKKCNHIFCEDCIQKWLKSHKNTCPICRINVIMEVEQ